MEVFVAQLLNGRKVLLETPCFGEYAIWLARHGALARELGADEPWSPDWPRLQKAALAGSEPADPRNGHGREAGLTPVGFAMGGTVGVTAKSLGFLQPRL